MSNRTVEQPKDSHSGEMNLCSAVLFGLSAFLGAWLIHYLSLRGSVVVLPSLCVLISATAVALLFFRPELGYSLAALSGMMGLYWFVGLELQNFPALNSWIALNLPDTTGTARSLNEAELRLAFGILLVFATIWALTALLPGSWRFWNRSTRGRSWPAFVLSCAVIVLWFLRSVSPYRIPIIADGPPPMLAILHVEKDGIAFHETRISVYRDGQYYFTQDERKLFQYRFPEKGAIGVLSPSLLTEVNGVADLSVVKDSHTGAAVPLRAWTAEGWYFSAWNKRKVSAFTTEYRTNPPKEIVDLFPKLVGGVVAKKTIPDGKDICFGFCYDPFGGLGLANLNDRCLYGNGTRCE